MKYNSKLIKVIMVALFVLVSANFLAATPDIVAQLRLYHGFKEGTPASDKVITSYYLKPITEKNVFSDVDIEKERNSLKRVFSLTDIKIVTRAGLVLAKGDDKSPFQVIVLNGRKLLLQLSTIDGKANRFKVEVLEEGKESRSLLETKLFLPEKKTTVLGFEDSGGSIYFLSFHREKDAPGAKNGADALKISSKQRPKMVKSVNPKYPMEALKKHVQGSVILNATTDEKGKVVDVQVVDGEQLLRQAAVDAVNQWRYEPYIVNGKPRAVQFTVVIKFNLNNKKQEIKPINIPSIKKPKLLKDPAPKYPGEALKAHVEGNVVLNVTTDTKGNVVNVEIVDGNKLLRQAAVDALKQWKYEPYILEGKAKPVRFTVVIKFRLNKGKPLNIPSIRRPKLVKSPAPKYPEEALKARVEGSVVINATTNAKGNVVNVELVDGPPMLCQAAIDALKQWQYEPYIHEGKPRAVRFTVVIKFNLNKKK